ANSGVQRARIEVVPFRYIAPRAVLLSVYKLRVCGDRYAESSFMRLPLARSPPGFTLRRAIPSCRVGYRNCAAALNGAEEQPERIDCAIALLRKMHESGCAFNAQNALQYRLRHHRIL